MNIYDCFMYFDEDLLLDLRLNMLNKYVNKFVITESTFLHSGQRKKLNFDYKNFSKFKNKIIYIVVDEPPPLFVVAPFCRAVMFDNIVSTSELLFEFAVLLF